jgi:hypothetical protein
MRFFEKVGAHSEMMIINSSIPMIQSLRFRKAHNHVLGTGKGRLNITE